MKWVQTEYFIDSQNLKTNYNTAENNVFQSSRFQKNYTQQWRRDGINHKRVVIIIIFVIIIVSHFTNNRRRAAPTKSN